MNILHIILLRSIIILCWIFVVGVHSGLLLQMSVFFCNKVSSLMTYKYRIELILIAFADDL